MIEEEIARFDWGRLQSFAGTSRSVPDDLRGLVSADSVSDAERLRDRIGLIVLLDGTLSEVCVAVATCLVSSIPAMHSAARHAAFDLLAQIGSADVFGPKVEQIGSIDVVLCRRVVARGFKYYVAGLEQPDSLGDRLHCIDLVTISGHADSNLKTSAIAALESACKDPQLASAIGLIDASLADLRLGMAE